MKEQPRTRNEEAGNAATLKGGLGQSGGGVKCESVWLAGKPALGRRKTFGLLVSFWQPDICTLQLKSDQLARPQPLCSNPRRRHLAREGKISSGTYMMMSIPTPMFVSEAPPFYDFAKKKWRERERDAQLKWQSELKWKGSHCYFYMQVRMWQRRESGN